MWLLNGVLFQIGERLQSGGYRPTNVLRTSGDGEIYMYIFLPHVKLS